jgi:hypothetical protein
MLFLAYCNLEIFDSPLPGLYLRPSTFYLAFILVLFGLLELLAVMDLLSTFGDLISNFFLGLRLIFPLLLLEVEIDVYSGV